MLCLNVRSTLPRIGIHTQLASLETHVRPAELHTEYQAPRSNQTLSQPTIDIDSYQSRTAYGYRTMSDFMSEAAQQGLSDVQSGTSSHTEAAWDMIENGSVPQGSSYIVSQISSKVDAQIARQRYLEVSSIPKPNINITPARLQGDIDPGKDETTAQTYGKADVTFKPGSFEIYLEQQGSIRMWTTEGKYDIYA